MVRGGGARGGAFAEQLMELLRGIAGIPPEDLLRLGIGLLLMIVILIMMRRTRSTPAPPVARATTCLVCGQELSERAYVDRYVPGWVACEGCYQSLPPRKQRQYRTRESA